MARFGEALGKPAVEVLFHQCVAGRKKSARLYDSDGFRPGAAAAGLARKALGGKWLDGKKGVGRRGGFSVSTIAVIFKRAKKREFLSWRKRGWVLGGGDYLFILNRTVGKADLEAGDTAGLETRATRRR